MKNVDIYIKGEYNKELKGNMWVYYIEYKGAIIKQSGFYNYHNTDNKSLTLIALDKALDRLKEPCNITIHSKYGLGFSSIRKASNKDMLVALVNRMVRVGHTYKAETDLDEGLLEAWDEKYGNKGEKEKIKAKREEADKLDYDKKIEEQARQAKDWRAMYDDLMGPSGGAWVPGSGGY